MTAIQDKFNLLLQNGLNLGSPIGDEQALPDGGSMQVYDAGRIYFHPRIGTAFECHGLILQTYIQQGEQSSGLGYPVSDETDDPDIQSGRMNRFERGTLVFDPASGVSVTFDGGDTIPVPQVTLKIADTFALTLDQGATLGLDDLAAAVGLQSGNAALEAVRSAMPQGASFQRLFTDLSSAQIDDLVAQAKQNDPAYAPPRLNNFLVVDCPGGFDTDSLANALVGLTGVVDFAYTQPQPSDASVVGTGNPRFGAQGYLAAPPGGIGVQAAWSAGADGSDMRFVDLEEGWFLGHEDLPRGIPLLAGINGRASFAHGCAVLGIVVAVDNAVGVVGIAPGSLPRIVSYLDPGPTPGVAQGRSVVASRILLATRSLRFGDLLLLEVQFHGDVGEHRGVAVPVEIDPGVFEAIRLAAKVGVIVVEAAGNGNVLLDDFRDPSGKAVLARTGPNAPTEFKDSGAIMVGACTSGFPHDRWFDASDPGVGSNFGSRVDCCAWGENIVTTGDKNNPTQVDGYATNPPFQGTSGATPQIGGTCLLIQNLQTILQPLPGQAGKLGPFTMRSLLQDFNNVTAVSGGIGGMPDMAKIIANEYVNP